MLDFRGGKTLVVPMIFVLSGQDAARYSALMEQVYRLRHRGFVEELGWKDLVSAQGLERDQFERPDAIHQICVRGGNVAGYQRMLPTVGPYVPSDDYPRLCEGPIPRGLDIYEMTHYCAAPACRKEACSTCAAGSELIAGFVEWGLACKVGKVIVEFEADWMLRALQLKFQVQPLGAEATIGDRRLLPAVLGFDRATLQAIRDYRKHWTPVVSFLGEHKGRGTPTAV